MIVLGREVCGNLEAALECEWLVTNGIGGYASGTVAGANTRRYHGLLVAALDPPRGRTLMLARVEEELVLGDQTFYLATNEYHDGTIYPLGYLHLQECRLVDGIPTFTFAVPGVTLTRTVWMEDGQNTTYLRYALSEASRSVTLRVSLFTTYRDHHAGTIGVPDWEFAVSQQDRGVEIIAREGAHPLRVAASRGSFIQTGVWYWRYLHRRERERGLDYLEDLYTPGLLVTDLQPGETVTLLASAEPWEALTTDFADAFERRQMRQRRLWSGSPLAHQSEALHDLVVAADQFVVRVLDEGQGTAPSVGIIAGYHWFEEWGRDALISLPGLLLVTGRYAEARALLQRYARLVDHGMLPVRLPDAGTPAQYESIDASLWYFQALHHYLRTTGDDDLLTAVYPTLVEIVRTYQDEARFGIAVDDDGLLAGGFPGLALTWMDARVDGWVVTPRRGKPVEVNALWYNAARLLGDWSDRLGKPSDHFHAAADRARQSFNERFWYPEGGYLYDVVDGEAGDDPTLRPNQLLAIGLAYPTLDRRRWETVLERVEERLLTPRGLRTLDPAAPGYCGHYGGDQRTRDGAYHQGTVWPWLTGAYVDAALRSGRHADSLRAFLTGIIATLREGGLGTIGEIFDGDAPYQGNGCIAQAWSVAEILRAWERLARA